MIADNIRVSVISIEGHMNRQVEGLTMTRETLDEVQAQVDRRLNRRVRKLRLSLRNGGVVLEGLARTYYDKQLAQHAVMEFLDSPILANEIEVL